MLALLAVAAFVFSAVVTRLVRDTALARGWVDASHSSRKVHQRPVPRLGGVGIVAGTLVALAVASGSAGLWVQLSTDAFALALVAGGALIAGLGLADDLRNLRARHKLVVQLGVALGAWLLGVRVEWLGAPFGFPVDLGFLSLPVTVLWVVGAINALNLIDGLDGLAGGVALIAASVNLALALSTGDVVAGVTMAALIGALLGFLLFNFNPASIFMGDSGSMFLGFVLAVTSLRTASSSPGAAAVLVPVVTLGLPVADTLLAMARRAAVGRPLFSADKEHIHHRLMRRFQLSHRGTVLGLYAVAGVLGLAALALAFAPLASGVWVLCAVVTGGVACLRLLGSFDRVALEQASQSRARNLALRRAIACVVRGLGKARDMDDVWTLLRTLAPTLSTTSLSLHVGAGVDAGRNDLVHTVPANGMTSVPRVAAVPVRRGGETLGTLIACWQDGRTEINRDEEIGLEEVSVALARTLSRIELAVGATAQLWVEPEPASVLRPAAGSRAAA